MADKQARYKVYVVRCWDEQNSQTDITIYRFTLEIPGTGQRFGFTNLEALMNALKHQLAQESSWSD